MLPLYLAWLNCVQVDTGKWLRRRKCAVNFTLFCLRKGLSLSWWSHCHVLPWLGTWSICCPMSLVLIDCILCSHSMSAIFSLHSHLSTIHSHRRQKQNVVAKCWYKPMSLHSAKIQKTVCRATLPLKTWKPPWDLLSCWTGLQSAKLVVQCYSNLVLVILSSCCKRLTDLGFFCFSFFARHSCWWHHKPLCHHQICTSHTSVWWLPGSCFEVFEDIAWWWPVQQFARCSGVEITVVWAWKLAAYQ